MLNVLFVIRAQIIVPQTIRIVINDFFKNTLELNPLRWIYHTFKDRLLNSLTIIGAGFGNLSEPPLTAGTCYHNVVTYKNHHRFLPPEKWRIPVYITTDITGHKIRLDKKEKADGNRFLYIWMMNLILLAALVLD